MKFSLSLFCALFLLSGCAHVRVDEQEVEPEEKHIIDFPMADASRFNPDLVGYDSDNSAFFASLAEIAYLEEPDGCRTIRDKIGLECAFLELSSVYSLTDTQLYLAGNADYLVIAFRGTEPKLVDVITDLKAAVYEPSGARNELVPPGHAGFRQTVIELMDENFLFKEVRKFHALVGSKSPLDEYPVYLTGHSMGAALALMSVPGIDQRYNFGGAYVFATPLAIARSAADAYDRKYADKIFNIMHDQDPVPRIGLVEKLRHVGTYYRVSPGGQIHRESVSEWSETSPHTMTHYISRILDSRNSTDCVRDPVSCERSLD